MLQKASQVDATDPVIVTMLRTLLNTDESTRDRVIASAAQVLPHWESGLLVVENHATVARCATCGTGAVPASRGSTSCPGRRSPTC
jgi:hypothetical protein